MTIKSCINFCSTQSTTYVYAGVEYGQECCTYEEYSQVVWILIRCLQTAEMHSLMEALKQLLRIAIWHAPAMLKRYVAPEVSRFYLCSSIMLIGT